jgi:hypothetical protein
MHAQIYNSSSILRPYRSNFPKRDVLLRTFLLFYLGFQLVIQKGTHFTRQVLRQPWVRPIPTADTILRQVKVP